MVTAFIGNATTASRFSHLRTGRVVEVSYQAPSLVTPLPAATAAGQFAFHRPPASRVVEFSYASLPAS